VCRLGFIAQFLSRPVVEGFVFGLAIFVTVKQLPKLFGIEGGSGDTLRQLGHLLRHLGDASGTTLLVGAGALVLLFGLERFAPRVPGGLVALVLGIVVSSVFDLSSHGVAIVGKVPSGLPSVSVPSVPSQNIPALIGAAGGMLLVIFSESLGAAQNFATKYGYEIDPKQELIALGVANVGSGFVGGLAAGGSLSQSAVNEGAGARSEMSPLVAALLMVVTVLVLMPLFKNLPEAMLAALIIHAVSHLWKVKEFRRYYAERRIEFWLGLATLLGAADPVPKAVVLEAGANPDLDITSTEMLEQLVESLRGAGVDLVLADVRQPVVDMMRRSGLAAKVGEDHIYHTIDEARPVPPRR
jgi:sulfate permease, SulP family